MKQELQKVTNKIRPNEVFYTYSHWNPKIIDGKSFIPVMKYYPRDDFPQVVHYLNEEQFKITAVSTENV